MTKLFLHRGKIHWWEIVQKLIIIGTDSPYFHVDVEYDENHFIGATWWKGVKIQPNMEFEKLKNRGRVIDAFKCVATINDPGFKEWLQGENGKKYDKLGVIYLGWLKLTGQREAANKFQKAKDYFCSEFIMTGLRKFASSPEIAFNDIPSTDVASPADIARSRWFDKMRN